MTVRLLIQRGVLFCLSLALVGALACSSCSKEADVLLEEEVADTSEFVDLATTIVTRIPKDSYGFIRWSGTHPAYARLMDSPWAGGTDISKALKNASPEVLQLVTALTQAGLDPLDAAVWRKLFADAVLFLAPQKDAEPVVGAVFKTEEIDLDEKLAAVKESVAAASEGFETVEVGGGQGFSFVPRTPNTSASGAPQRVFFVTKGEVAVVASALSPIEGILTADAGSLPDLVQTETYKKAVKGFPGRDSTFSVGYLDAARLLADAKEAQAKAGDPQAMLKDAPPVEAASIALSMRKTPESEMRLLYDPSRKESQVLKAFSASTSSGFVDSIPGKALMFLSIDGPSLKSLRDLAAANPGAAAVSSQLSFLDTTKRIGIVAGLAPLMGAIMPIPDLSIMIESTAAADTATQLEKLVGFGTMLSPATSGMSWGDEEILGTKVKSMKSQFGIGLYLAAKDDLVLLTSSKAQMQGVLGGSIKSAFRSASSKRVTSVLENKESIGNVYVNFEELASVLETAGGMLNMYAPQGQGAGELLSPESIEAYKKMGVMTLWFSQQQEEGVLGIHSFYDKTG